MLHEFITANREQIIANCRARISSRPAPRATDAELEHGVPLFLEQLVSTLRFTLEGDPAIGESASKHGKELLRRGFTIAQVVHDYGGVCQAITQLASELAAPISPQEFRVLNRCLDNAIAEAVTEYGRLRDHEGAERLGMLAHELRNLLNTAILAFEVLKTGSVGVTGSTGGVLGRSLAGLRNLISSELTAVRMDAGAQMRERVVVREFLEDAEVAGSMEANARALHLTVSSVPKEVAVNVDRQILDSVVANLLHNAFKFTRPHGLVVLRAHATTDRVLIEVEDQCGGLPPGKVEELFCPFEQRGADRTGMGLGLAICYRGVAASGGELRVINRPDAGCVFAVDLPRAK